MLLGVDVGGTFTDAALFDGRVLHTAKAPTTPRDQSDGVRSVVAAVLERAGIAPEQVEHFAHGMTVGTNALLEERGARTALVATTGFTDLLEIGRQDRPSLYELCVARPRGLVSEELRFGVAGRVGPAGEIEPLAGAEVERLAAAVRESDAESVAICLLFSYVDPSHERALAKALRATLGGRHVSVSHEVIPQFREFERCSTTVIDAYLAPLLSDYFGRLASACEDGGLPPPAVMRSSGGVAPISETAGAGAGTVLSGPAGGAVGAGLLARLSGDGNAVGIDMGGTSCDVCVIEGGEVRRTDARSVGGRVIQLPMVDVHTVGAGGGSVAWRDRGGALRVGPRSAGAEPGPACYGRGGSEPTVTDANLLLGYLEPGGELAGGVSLDPDAAACVVGELAASLELDPISTAEGIVRVANQGMIRALRVVTVERGVDPRPFALMPFGGAGPMHAAALADELEMRTLLCPRAGGVLSALGLISSDRRRDTARTVMLRDETLTADRIAAEVATLRGAIGEGLEHAEVETVYEMRYRGQAFELPIPASPAPDPGELAEAFAAEHERRYSYRDPSGEIELVTIRLALVEPGPQPALDAGAPGTPEEGTRRARFDGSWHEARVVHGEPPAGLRARGPCVFELPDATFVLPPGWRGEVDRHGTVVARRDP